MTTQGRQVSLEYFLLILSRMARRQYIIASCHSSDVMKNAHGIKPSGCRAISVNVLNFDLVMLKVLSI